MGVLKLSSKPNFDYVHLRALDDIQKQELFSLLNYEFDKTLELVCVKIHNSGLIEMLCKDLDGLPKTIEHDLVAKCERSFKLLCLKYRIF